jgi:F-type H+-transporting ATPase subunit delta
MALKGAIARRYAEAVFDIGHEQNAIEQWRQDIAFLNELLGNRRLIVVLTDPKISFAKKEAIIRDLASSRVQPGALGLALALVERGLVDYMPSIARDFTTLYDEYHHQIQATVTAALPLTPAEQSDITAYLQRITGKTIQLQVQVDNSIIGGIIVRVGDTLIDGSVLRRLKVLREQIISGTISATR